MKSKKVAIAVVIIALISIAMYFHFSNEKEKIVIFHAGSLSIPFEKVGKEFEKRYGINVLQSPAGSIETIRKVTELGKRADVVGSADHELIQKMMEPDYADYCIEFATNRMVIAYTEKSRYGNEINESNWYKILNRKGVRFGFSDPNKDPCGYRSMMLLQLAELYYKNDSIFDELIEKNVGVVSEYENGSYIIKIPDSMQLKSNDKIVIRPMEVELMASLETGEIDYLFIYQSVASQHGVRFLNLPPEIDLSSEINYSVEVELHSGKVVKAKPIIYGVTIPKNAPHKNLAIKFLQFMLSENGKKLLEESGLNVMDARCDNKDLLPPSIKQYVK